MYLISHRDAIASKSIIVILICLCLCVCQSTTAGDGDAQTEGCGEFSDGRRPEAASG